MGSVRVGVLVLQKTDSSATTRGKVRGVLVDGVSVMGFGTVSVDGDVYLTVLRWSYVRTRTSTTPVLMGCGTRRERWCFNGWRPSLLSGVRKGAFW